MEDSDSDGTWHEGCVLGSVSVPRVCLSVESNPGPAGPVYHPPLRDNEANLKKTYQKLTKLSQEAQK